MMKKLLLVLVALCMISAITFIYRLTRKQLSSTDHIKPVTSTSSKTFRKTTHLDEELHTLLKLTEWPLPPAKTSLDFSTHPKTSIIFMLHPRSTYVVGETLEVLIIAKNHKGQSKTYGGDYFHAKLHSPGLNAGVSGSVTDNYNGSYTASFILQWPGETMVSIKLMYSSEAVAILHEKRATRQDMLFFKGYFVKNGIEEVVECNVDLPGQDVCEYYDEVNEEKWVCQRPKTLPCDAYRDHSSGGTRNIFSYQEEEFFSSMQGANVLVKREAEDIFSAKSAKLHCGWEESSWWSEPDGEGGDVTWVLLIKNFQQTSRLLMSFLKKMS